ncbi:hypothetical protein, conserved [Angomonas deanei]|uniref:Uncharacterized protein n=1 Tax=Angomonas deanei TaxID=59799 RepID=A0A7G2C6F9_9TRYP|nr:hypothetical protein, conserved [Angomonas deanei]
MNTAAPACCQCEELKKNIETVSDALQRARDENADLKVNIEILSETLQRARDEKADFQLQHLELNERIQHLELENDTLKMSVETVSETLQHKEDRIADLQLENGEVKERNQHLELENDEVKEMLRSAHYRVSRLIPQATEEVHNARITIANLQTENERLANDRDLLARVHEEMEEQHAALKSRTEELTTKVVDRDDTIKELTEENRQLREGHRSASHGQPEGSRREESRDADFKVTARGCYYDPLTQQWDLCGLFNYGRAVRPSATCWREVLAMNSPRTVKLPDNLAAEVLEEEITELISTIVSALPYLQGLTGPSAYLPHCYLVFQEGHLRRELFEAYFAGCAENGCYTFTQADYAVLSDAHVDGYLRTVLPLLPGNVSCVKVCGTLIRTLAWCHALPDHITTINLRQCPNITDYSPLFGMRVSRTLIYDSTN